MEELTIVLDDEEAQLDALDKVPTDKVGAVATCRIIGIREATQEGNPGVIIRFDLEGGVVAIKVTTLKLFLTAADALKAKYGDPRQEDRGSGGIWPNN